MVLRLVAFHHAEFFTNISCRHVVNTKYHDSHIKNLFWAFVDHRRLAVTIADVLFKLFMKVFDNFLPHLGLSVFKVAKKLGLEDCKHDIEGVVIELGLLKELTFSRNLHLYLTGSFGLFICWDANRTLEAATEDEAHRLFAELWLGLNSGFYLHELKKWRLSLEA